MPFSGCSSQLNGKSLFDPSFHFYGLNHIHNAWKMDEQQIQGLHKGHFNRTGVQGEGLKSKASRLTYFINDSKGRKYYKTQAT